MSETPSETFILPMYHRNSKVLVWFTEEQRRRVVKLYLTDRATVKTICAILNREGLAHEMTDSRARRILELYRVPIRSRPDGTMAVQKSKRPPPDVLAELSRLYESGYSMKEIVELRNLDMKPGTLWLYLKGNGTVMRRPGNRLYKPTDRPPVSSPVLTWYTEGQRQRVVELYEVEKMTLTAVVSIMNKSGLPREMNTSNVRKILELAGVILRPVGTRPSRSDGALRLHDSGRREPHS